MNIPGFVWTAVLALIPLLVQWLEGDYFSSQKWVSVAILVLLGIGKLIEVFRPQLTDDVGTRGLAAGPGRSRVRRFLLG